MTKAVEDAQRLLADTPPDQKRTRGEVSRQQATCSRERSTSGEMLTSSPALLSPSSQNHHQSQPLLSSPKKAIPRRAEEAEDENARLVEELQALRERNQELQ